MPAMTSSGQGSERLNAQLLVDSIPALIHTAKPDAYLDYFNLNYAHKSPLWRCSELRLPQSFLVSA
jgi:hypothetical protein